MSRILVVAPHADDESLGCGGTLLRHIDNGDEVHWLLVTGMTVNAGYSEEQILTRSQEIVKVSEMYGFKEVHELFFPPAALDTLSKGTLIGAISERVKKIQPDTIYTVFRNDAHSDHEVVFDSLMAATKSFRYPFIKRTLAYETISETDFGMKPEDTGFRPNVYFNIEKYIENKLKILEVFKSEMGEFPFPRSAKALTALAQLRGVQSNCEAAEAFMLIKEIN